MWCVGCRQAWSFAWRSKVFSAGMIASSVSPRTAPHIQVQLYINADPHHKPQPAESSFAAWKKMELGNSSAMSDLEALRWSMLYEERAKNRERFGYGNDALFGPRLATSSTYTRHALRTYSRTACQLFDTEQVDANNYSTGGVVTREGTTACSVFRKANPTSPRVVSRGSDATCWRCTCFNFNSWGVPCRHIITVMTQGECPPDEAAFDCYFRQRWRRHAKESGGDTDALLPIRVESTPSRPPCDPCDAEAAESNMTVFQTSKVAAELAITRYILIYEIYICCSL